MTFDAKIAKLGRANNVDFCVDQNGIATLFISYNGTKEKTFQIDDRKYNLGDVVASYIYNQMIPLSNNLCLCRLGESISIVNIRD